MRRGNMEESERDLREDRRSAPRGIWGGPGCEVAVKRGMCRREVEICGVANKASASGVGCHTSRSPLGLEGLGGGGGGRGGRELECGGRELDCGGRGGRERERGGREGGETGGREREVGSVVRGRREIRSVLREEEDRAAVGSA